MPKEIWIAQIDWCIIYDLTSSNFSLTWDTKDVPSIQSRYYKLTIILA